MINKLYNHLLDIRDRQRITIALSKGSISKNARKIDLTNSLSWEFSGFSQNGEDGIIDVLRSQLLLQNRYSIEIGFADGMENNTSWLISTSDYNGLGIDGSKQLISRARRTIERQSIGFSCVDMFVTKESISKISGIAAHKDPDIFSLDIDGNDYYIAEGIFNAGFQPKIFIVEYNSAYGPDNSMTIPYTNDFVFSNAHESRLYYGASISAWKKVFSKNDYKFVTVDSKGVNAFFIRPDCFPESFIDNISGLDFAENCYQFFKFKQPWNEQFKLIEALPFSYV